MQRGVKFEYYFSAGQASLRQLPLELASFLYIYTYNYGYVGLDKNNLKFWIIPVKIFF